MTARRRHLTTALATVGIATLVAVLPGCAPGGGEGEGRSSGVVVTTNILGDVTRAVVGDEAEVTVLMGPDTDPHSFGISARQAATLEDADLLIHNGMGLEEGVLRNVEAAEEAGVPTLAVGEEADPLRYELADAELIDGTDGQPDPHFWTDPQRVRIAAELISEQVIEQVDGVDAAAVRARTEDYLGELDALDTWMAERFAEIPEADRALVTNHHVFGYLADRYGFEVVGAVIPSGTTLASPSASDLDALARTLRQTGVRAIFADSSQPDRLAQVLAEEAGVHVRVIELHSESLTAAGEGADTYLRMMRANTDAIVTGLAPD